MVVGAPVRSLAFGADGVTLYVLNGTTTNASVSVIDTANGQTLSSCRRPQRRGGSAAQPRAVRDLDGAERRHAQGTSLQTGRSLGTIPLDLTGIALAFPSSGTRMYILKGTGSVWNIAEVSAGSTTISRIIPAAAHSVDLVASADGSTLYDLVGYPRNRQYPAHQAPGAIEMMHGRTRAVAGPC